MSAILPLLPVSVVIPCFDCEATLERSVRSVFSQTQLPAEVLLINDASRDGTERTMKRLREEFGDTVRHLTLDENRGASAARNRGWAEASQPYLAFLDSDDTWHPMKLELQSAYMRQHPEVAVSGHLHCFSADRQSTWEPPKEADSPQAVSLCRILLRNQFVTPSVMLKTDLPFRFADDQRHMEDHRLWVEIVASGSKTVKLNLALATLHKPIYGHSGLSAALWDMEKAELRNYLSFWRQGFIGFPGLLALQAWSCAKFAKRCLVVLLRPSP